MSAADQKLHRTAQSLAEAAGVSRYTVQAVRKTAKAEGSPFPHYATVRDLRTWLKARPGFVARKAFKTGAPPSLPPDQAPPAAGKSDESPDRHDPRTPSPERSAPPLAPAA